MNVLKFVINLLKPEKTLEARRKIVLNGQTYYYLPSEIVDMNEFINTPPDGVIRVKSFDTILHEDYIKLPKDLVKNEIK